MTTTTRPAGVVVVVGVADARGRRTRRCRTRRLAGSRGVVVVRASSDSSSSSIEKRGRATAKSDDDGAVARAVVRASSTSDGGGRRRRRVPATTRARTLVETIGKIPRGWACEGVEESEDDEGVFWTRASDDDSDPPGGGVEGRIACRGPSGDGLNAPTTVDGDAFEVCVLGTLRSRKRRGVALEPTRTASPNARFSRVVAEAIRAEAERAFDPAGFDFETFRGVVETCDAGDSGAIAVAEEDETREEENGDWEEDEERERGAKKAVDGDGVRHVRVRLFEQETNVEKNHQWWWYDAVFVQAAHAGMSMEKTLEHLLINARARTGETMSASMASTKSSEADSNDGNTRVYLLFDETESISTTFLYLTFKSMRERLIDVELVMLTKPTSAGGGLGSSELVDAPCWRLPYAWALDGSQHRVSSLRSVDTGRFAIERKVRAELEKYAWTGKPDLGPLGASFPRVSRLGALLSLAASEGAVIFNACGPDGSNGGTQSGSLQRLCVSAGVAYTGSAALAARACADVVTTAKTLANARIDGVGSLAKRLVPTSALLSKAKVYDLETGSHWGGSQQRTADGATRRLWVDILASLNWNASVRVKPLFANSRNKLVKVLGNDKDLVEYINESTEATANGTTHAAFVFEPCFDTSSSNTWVRAIVTIFGDGPGRLAAFTPSVKMRDDAPYVLATTLPDVIGDGVVQLVKERSRRIGDALQIEGLAQIEAYVNVENGEMIVDEVNTTPELDSPEAVAFAQANAEDPSIDAETLCARAVSLAFARRYR